MGLFETIASVLKTPLSTPASDVDVRDATPVRDVVPRTRARIHGIVTTVLVQPLGESPRYVVQIDDGTGAVTASWLGRHNIAGIDPGVRIEAEGFVCQSPGGLLMYNPRYTIHGPKETEL